MWTDRPTRWPMTLGLAAGALLAVAWNNAPMPGPKPAETVATHTVSDRGLAGVSVHEEVREYVLSGKTVEGLRRQLRRTGFTTSHVQQHWSQTDGHLEVQWDRSSGWACGERPVVRLEITTHLPRTGDVPDEIGDAFVPLREALEQHEDAHSMQWLHAARALRDELSALQGEGCIALRRQTESAVDRWNARALVAGGALDSETFDGVGTGVVLEIEDDMRVVHFPHAIVHPMESATVEWSGTLGRFEPYELDDVELARWTQCLQETERSSGDPGTQPHATLSLDTSAGHKELGLYLSGLVVRRGGRAWRGDCVAALLRENGKVVGASVR